MIAKEIKKKSNNKASFKKLANYITRADSDSPIPATITNCSEQTYTLAIKSIEALQDIAKGKQDKTYHLVLSFHPNDDLSPKRLAYIESECCKALGFENHQRLSALHRDTKNPHLHIAINRVHPKTKRQITPYFSYQKLAKFCQRMELELGLTPDNHMPNHEISAFARDMEAYSGKVSLERYILEEVKDHLSPKNSDELQQQLQQFGLTIKSYRNGWVVGDGNTFVKASLLGNNAKEILRTLSPEKPQAKLDIAKQTYQPAAADDLWQAYQEQRNQALESRKIAREQLSIAANHRYAQLSDKYQNLRREIQQDSLLTKQQKFALYKKLGEARRKEYQDSKTHFHDARLAARSKHPLPTWQSFLVVQALNGNTEALKKLQNFASKRGFTAVLNDIQTQYGAVDHRIRQAFEETREKRQKRSEKQRVLTDWINSRNQMRGKAADVQKHQYFGTQKGQFTYQGSREIAEGQFVALLSRDDITYVKPISAGQQRFLKTIRRGSSLEINEQGQFYKKKVRS